MPAGIATALVGIGVGAETAGFLAPAILGAGVGAGGSALLGGDPGKGALFGGLTGGVLGFGPSVGASLGVGTTVADLGLGAAAGAASNAITGGDVGKGALFGAAAGGITSALGGPAGGASDAGASGAAPSAASAVSGTPAAATAIQAGGIPDLTAGLPGASGSALAAPIADISGIPGITTTATSLAAPLSAGAAAASGGFAGGLSAGGGASPGGVDTSVLAQPGQVSSQELAPIPGSAVAHPGMSTPVNAGVNGAGNQPILSGGGPGTSFDKFVANPSLKTAGGIIGANPEFAIGAAGLGFQAMNQPKTASPSALSKTLEGQAAQFGAQGAQLQSYINNGNLPPGAMTAIQTAAKSAKANLRSKFASMGLTGSTAEATALGGVDEHVAGQIFETANNLLQSGIKESGLSADIYRALLGDANTQNSNMTTAISNFAAAIAGGGSRRAA